ncbi:MAG: pyrimidine utilization protein D [Sphingobium sp.]
MPEVAGLYWESHGPDDGQPVILSPGLGGSGNYWLPNVPALTEAGYRVILYDHRGTGRSDRALPDIVTVDQFADDILTLMDGIGLSRAHVIGHAAGGVAGLALAMKAPERMNKLVAVNGWAKADPHFLRCFEARLALLRHAGVEAFLRAQPIFLYPADWICTYTTELDAELPHQLADFPGMVTMEKRIAALANFAFMKKLGGMPVKTLVLATGDDMLVPSRAGKELAEQLGGVDHEVMAWGGHACNVTDPATFNRIVLAFLRS